ncbi:MAG: Crp/Fnr family transcriptional regulator [Draconibacterium sp.]|nr:Crp/Fnr family transcriptional regulator [Draconibacterium sp.]
MAETQEIDCINCLKGNIYCCKKCFEDDEIYIFKCLTEKELEYLIDEKQQITFKAGETIVKQNSSSTYVVCIREGLAKVYIEGEKGKNLIVRLIHKHDFVTGGGLFNVELQPFTISAATSVTCCLIDSVKIAKLFSENKQFAIELLRHHTKQNNYLLSKLVNLTQKYMPGRVADTLLYLKNDIYNDNIFTVPFSRQDLADMSNMTKESFVRILQQFKESNIVAVQGNTIEIIDEISLNSISKNG